VLLRSDFVRSSEVASLPETHPGHREPFTGLLPDLLLLRGARRSAAHVEPGESEALLMMEWVRPVAQLRRVAWKPSAV